MGPILDLDRRNGVTFASGRSGKVTAWKTPSSRVGLFEAADQIDHVRLVPIAERVVAADSSGRIHLLSSPELKSQGQLGLPVSEQSKSELHKRLARQIKQFEQDRQVELRELKKLGSIAAAKGKVEKKIDVAESKSESSTGVPGATSELTNGLSDAIDNSKAKS